MPDADYPAYVAFMQTHTMREQVPEARLVKLYRDYAVDKYSLADRAYLTGVHPMELWLLSYWPQHPQATRHELVEVSRPERISSYAWLFKASKKRAQDTRIGIMLEEDAFVHIQKRWARLGYPFDHLVPSYATAIGSSADRPGALAELLASFWPTAKRCPSSVLNLWNSATARRTRLC